MQREMISNIVLNALLKIWTMYLEVLERKAKNKTRDGLRGSFWSCDTKSSLNWRESSRPETNVGKGRRGSGREIVIVPTREVAGTMTIEMTDIRVREAMMIVIDRTRADMTTNATGTRDALPLPLPTEEETETMTGTTTIKSETMIVHAVQCVIVPLLRHHLLLRQAAFAILLQLPNQCLLQLLLLGI
jgi:hypothetical protein